MHSDALLGWWRECDTWECTNPAELLLHTHVGGDDAASRGQWLACCLDESISLQMHVYNMFSGCGEPTWKGFPGWLQSNVLAIWSFMLLRELHVAGAVAQAKSIRLWSSAW